MDEQLVDYVLTGIRPSKQDVHKTTLQLYHLEHLQGPKFTLQDIEQNLCQIDEELGRDKQQLCREHLVAAMSNQHKTYCGNDHNQLGGRGRGCLLNLALPQHLLMQRNNNAPKLYATIVVSLDTPPITVPSILVPLPHGMHWFAWHIVYLLNML
jgi:hypothetical protein